MSNTSKQIVRLNDASDHGGKMISATGHFKANGIRVCVDGDIHSCPMRGHGNTPVNGTANPQSTGKNIIKTGDRAQCGAIIVEGSPNNFTP